MGSSNVFTMQHIESFDCNVSAAEFEEIARSELLPYWRSRGFEVKFYRYEASLGPAQYVLVTGMENFASIDSWPEMAAGEEQGRALMAKYLALVKNLRASVLKDIEA